VMTNKFTVPGSSIGDPAPHATWPTEYYFNHTQQARTERAVSLRMPRATHFGKVRVRSRPKAFVHFNWPFEHSYTCE
jgi:hypothetical protein